MVWSMRDFVFGTWLDVNIKEYNISKVFETLVLKSWYAKAK